MLACSLWPPGPTAAGTDGCHRERHRHVMMACLLWPPGPTAAGKTEGVPQRTAPSKCCSLAPQPRQQVRMPPVAKRPAAAQAPDAQPAPAGKRAKTRVPLSPTWTHGKLASLSMPDLLDRIHRLIGIPVEAVGELNVVSSFEGVSPVSSFLSRGPAINELCAAVDMQRACHHLLQNKQAEHIFGKLTTIGASECIKHCKNCSPDLGKIDLVLCGGDAAHIRDAAPCLVRLMICDLDLRPYVFDGLRS